MLDDLKYIARFDSNDALGVVEHQFEQLEHQFNVPEQKYPVQNIVFAGMGGSALAAQLSLTWPGYQIPFEICRDYTIPKYTSSDTLFIASSYSGNTEEALSALEEASKRGAHLICISSGGKLQERAAELKALHILLPGGYQPRFAVLYSLKALVTILEKCGFVSAEQAEKELHQAAQYLKQAVADWRADVLTKDNQAKQLAEHLMGKTPIIYGAKLYSAAYKWKINFNENAKNTAWCNAYPEFDHNEFLGWSSHPVEKPFGVVDLISSFDHPQIQRRFTISDRLLSGHRPKATTIKAQGETVLEQLLWTVALGDMTSIYLALLNGLNPTPVDLIEKLKSQLA